MEYLNIFKSQILQNVKGLVYFTEDNIDDKFDYTDIISYSLVFSDNILKISTSSDGFGLSVFIDDDLKDIDMQENGELKILELLNVNEFKVLVNEKILEIKKILYEDIQVGISFEFSRDKKVVFLNLGDDIYFYETLPLPLIEEGYIEI